MPSACTSLAAVPDAPFRPTPPVNASPDVPRVAEVPQLRPRGRSRGRVSGAGGGFADAHASAYSAVPVQAGSQVHLRRQQQARPRVT